MADQCSIIQDVSSLNVQGRIIPVQHSQCHGCWRPGSLRRQGIGTNDTDYVEEACFCLTRGTISITCVMPVWRNDITCRYNFMFSMKHSAHKGLTEDPRTHYSCFSSALKFAIISASCSRNDYHKLLVVTSWHEKAVCIIGPLLRDSTAAFCPHKRFVIQSFDVLSLVSL